MGSGCPVIKRVFLALSFLRFCSIPLTPLILLLFVLFVVSIPPCCIGVWRSDNRGVYNDHALFFLTIIGTHHSSPDNISTLRDFPWSSRSLSYPPHFSLSFVVLLPIRPLAHPTLFTQFFSLQDYLFLILLSCSSVQIRNAASFWSNFFDPFFLSSVLRLCPPIFSPLTLPPSTRMFFLIVTFPSPHRTYLRMLTFYDSLSRFFFCVPHSTCPFMFTPFSPPLTPTPKCFHRPAQIHPLHV